MAAHPRIKFCGITSVEDAHLAAGVAAAQATIDDGSAAATLDALVRRTHELAGTPR